MDDHFYRLSTMADAMNGLTRSLLARVQYDPVCNSLYWSDELPGLSDKSQLEEFRRLLRHRTSLILGEVETEYEVVWEKARELFPKWPGFHPSRINPTKKLIAFFEREQEKAIDDLLEDEEDPVVRARFRREWTRRTHRG